MKKSHQKVAAIALSITLVLPIAACGKRNGRGNESVRSGDKILSSSPWYNYQKTEVKPVIENSDSIDYIYNNFSGIDDKYYAVLTSGYYKLPADNEIDWDTYNYNDYLIAFVTVYNRTTNETVNTINLKDGLSANEYIDTARYTEGKLVVSSVKYDFDNGNSTTTETEYDPVTGNVLDSHNVENNNSQNNPRIYSCGDYKISAVTDWSSDYSISKLMITDPDNSKHEVLINEDDKSNVYDVYIIIPLEDNNALVCASTDSGSKLYDLNLNSKEISEADSKEYEWLNPDKLSSAQIGSDGAIYYTDFTGISKIDMDKKTVEEVFNYSWCGLNRTLLGGLDLVECSNDSFVMFGQQYSYGFNSSNQQGDYFIFEFTRGTNPHAGKTVMELYSSGGYVDQVVGDAIIDFNETNSDYYIVVSDRYSEKNYYDTDKEINSDDSWEEMNLNATAKMSSDLAVDIINGDGPDILLNTSALGQLNNSAYLADLSPYVGNLDPNNYFTNIIEGAGTDGALYQVPVSFMIDGIQTDKKYAGKSGVGFTTEEYEKFLNDVLNGNDVISAGQAIYFTKLFGAMSDAFIKNNKADFSGPEFEMLASYVKENVRERSISWDAITYEDTVNETTGLAVGAAVLTGVVKKDNGNDEVAKAFYGTCYGIGGYLSTMTSLNGASAILGIPSSDGRGPMFSPNLSVAVSAQAQNIDACGEFVKLLLSDEVQRKLANNDVFVVNREAFRQSSEAAIKYYNDENSNNDGLTGSGIQSHSEFTTKNIDEMEEIIMSCSRMNSTDSAINLILVEEMPAYFSGQKDLADVTRIAQDRVQKVLAERG